LIFNFVFHFFFVNSQLPSQWQWKCPRIPNSF